MVWTVIKGGVESADGADSDVKHLTNVWHYVSERGVYSESPLHFASAFKTLVIVPSRNENYDRDIDEDYQEFEYELYYALAHKRERIPLGTISDSDTLPRHEWFKDVVFHDPMEMFGSYADGKGQLSKMFVTPENEVFEVSSSVPIDKCGDNPEKFPVRFDLFQSSAKKQKCE